MTIATTPEAPTAEGYTPGQIPESDVRPPPSAWAAGDVHHTHEQIVAESPAGIAAAAAPDPRDTEILRLSALLAGRSNDPAYVAPEDAKDAEIAALKGQLAGAADSPAPVEATAQTVDPRDAEIAQLRDELAGATEPAPPAASSSTAGDTAAGEVTPA